MSINEIRHLCAELYIVVLMRGKIKAMYNHTSILFAVCNTRNVYCCRPCVSVDLRMSFFSFLLCFVFFFLVAISCMYI